MFVLYCICLFIVQIIIYVKAVKGKKIVIWNELFIVEIISIISIILYEKIYNYYNVFESISSFGVTLFSSLTKIVFIFWLIASIITKILLNKDIYNTKHDSKLFSIIICCIIMFIICTIISIKPLISERNRRELFSDYVISYLNNKYGNNDYKIEKIYNWNDCGLRCLDSGYPNAYEFTIRSNNLNESFQILINIENKNIIRDNYLEIYNKNQ